MSNYPELADVFVDRTGNDNISSSDPNNAFDGIEAIEGLVGALGKPQSWSTTLTTLIRRYKSGLNIYLSGGSVIVGSGEAVLENTNGSKWVFRRNTTNVTLGSANLDVGSVAAATYYVYMTGGTAATTSPLKFSTDPLAPSGIGTAPFRKLGYFIAPAAAVAATYFVDDGNPNGYVLGSQPSERILRGFSPIGASGTAVISFSGAFQTTNYSFVAFLYQTDASGIRDGQVYTISKTVNDVTIRNSNESEMIVDWIAMGL